MNPLLIALIIPAVIVVAAAFWGVAIYNRLITLRERYRNAFSQIDVQLKRRHDLIPNLVEAVKATMAHERETLDKVIQARNAASTATRQAAADPTNAAAVRQAAESENVLVAALSRMMILSEAYPDLKANQNAGQLMEELGSTENRIAFARQHYNDTVMGYNSYRRSFPQVTMANALGFTDAAFFEITDPRERQAATVNFGPAGTPAASGLA